MSQVNKDTSVRVKESTKFRLDKSKGSKSHDAFIAEMLDYFDATGIMPQSKIASPAVTLSTEGSAIEFAVSGGVVDGDDAVVNEPMQWVVVVRKNGKEIDRKTLTFEDGKQIATDDLKLYYK